MDLTAILTFASDATFQVVVETALTQGQEVMRASLAQSAATIVGTV